LEERLEHFSSFERFRGLRHIAQAESDHFLARGDVVLRIGKLKEFGLTYDILIYPQQMAAALSLVKRLPEQPFVVDHLAKPLIREGRLEPWSSRMREMATLPNVWCKVSGMVTEADWAEWSPEDIRPYLDVVFETFGPNRLMVGSDWPVCLLAASYDEVWGLVEEYAAHLSQADRGKLFGGNAAAFYGLET
jgi:L-fuconolactonase